MLQGVALCCSVLQGVAVCRRVLLCVAGCCRVLQCDAMCCSVLRKLEEEQVMETSLRFEQVCVAV